MGVQSGHYGHAYNTSLSTEVRIKYRDKAELTLEKAMGRTGYSCLIGINPIETNTVHCSVVHIASTPEDEMCSAGIKSTHQGGSVCCPSSCGSCTGNGCGQRPGGWRCCGGSIMGSLRVCQNPLDTACIVTPRTYCAVGLVSYSNGVEYCCASSCGQCGGDGCHERPGGSNLCCVGNIISNDITCARQSSVGCVVR